VVDRARVDAQNPWPWLEPFTELQGEGGLFNGRDEDAQALLRGVLAAPVCVLFGKSGLGKTSLLLAGLFPLLRKRCLLPVPLRRLDHGASAPTLSAQLFRALDDAIAVAKLRSTESADGGQTAHDYVARLWERLHDRRQQLVDTEGRRWTIVFVLDQFEEIFTLQPDEQLRRLAFEQLGDLLENRVPSSVALRLDQHDELLDRLELADQPYRFLISLREDFLPDLEAWTDLLPRLGPNRIRLLPMSGKQAFDAIHTTGGELVDEASARGIVEFLDRQVARSGAAARTSASRRIEPALLSLVCASLNADRLAKQPPGLRLDIADLEERGTRILDRFYDDAFLAIAEEQRALTARWVEANLITDGGTRRPYPMAAVDEALRMALRKLVDRRLLRFENTEQGEQVELVHDRLAAVALSRARAAQQLAEATARLQREKDAAELELIRQRARAAELAEERANDALRSTRHARRLSIGLGVLLVAVSISLGWAVVSQRLAAEAATAATSAAQDEVIARRQKEAKDEDLNRALLANAQAAALLSSDKPDRTSEASELLSRAKRSYETSLLPPPDAQACPAGRRLYPQVGSEQGRDMIDRLAPTLRKAGFIVPPTEVLAPRKMPSVTEVRFFRMSEEASAREATAALASAGLSGVQAKYVRGYEDSKAMRPCHFELWLAVDASDKP
jgi:hypothetical protein